MVPRMSAPAEKAPQPSWMKWTRWALSVFAIAFMLWAGAGLVRDWRAAGSVQIDWTLALASLLPALASNLALAMAWAVLLQGMVQPTPPLGPLLSIYGLSNLGRYMPGKVGMPLMRITGAARWGASAAATSTSVALELLSWIATASALSLLCFVLAHGRTIDSALGPTQVATAAAIMIGTVVGAVIDRKHLPRPLLDRLGLVGTGPLLPARLLALHTATWLCWALHAWLCARAVGASHAQALESMPYFVLSPVVGFLALLAPAGVGVREAMISIGLSGAVGPKAALMAALITRVASLIADVAGWLGTRSLDQVDHATT
jgi:uncharacterized membrane protein YbhN (UPF0104 family)